MPTPKKRYLDSTPVVTKQQLAKMNKQANTRERNIAKAYLEAGPNIVNLAKAAYHWYNSVPWLGGKDENGNILVTGEVPTPGMRNPKNIVKGVRAITSPKGIVKGVRRITKANAQKIIPKRLTTAQDAESTLSGLLPNAKPLVAEKNPRIIANAKDVLAHPSTGRRFQLYKDVYEKEIPKEVKQIYRNAVLPRLQKARSDYLPLQEVTQEGVEKALSKDYTVYPERVFKDAGKNGVAGVTFPDGHIAIKEGYEDYILGHEVRHRLQQSLTPHKQELKLLHDAYDDNFVNLGREYPEFKGLHLNLERETLNYDARRSLVGDDVLKKFNLDTQNAVIDDMSDTDVFNAVEEADGYGSAYIDFLRKNNLLTHKKAQQFREAMKHVGAYVAPVGVALGTSAATLYNNSNKNKNIR